METGEEDETTHYKCRAKLYNFVTLEDKKEWRERGTGVLHLNVREPKGDGGDDDKVRARLIMRADGSHRVVLNTPVKKELNFGAVKGVAPTNGYVHFLGSIDDKPKLEMLQLKVWKTVECVRGLSADVCNSCGHSMQSSCTIRLQSCKRKCSTLEKRHGLIRIICSAVVMNGPPVDDRATKKAIACRRHWQPCPHKTAHLGAR